MSAPSAMPEADADRTGLHIGLTGGIGSGKSTVARLLAQRGAHLVDTDALARGLSAPGGEAIPALRAQFGDRAITPEGALDRVHMRQLAFTDPASRRALEAILHPLIAVGTRREAERARPGQVVVFDVPLLTESAHWRSRVDRILVVDCALSTQRRRVRERSGWPDVQIEQVIQQQATREQRRSVADAVLFNDGLDLPALDEAVARLWGTGFFHHRIADTV